MLKNQRLWLELTTEERLFLLAMAHELPKVSGLEILYTDVMKNTGFDNIKLCEIAYRLERKDLIKVYGSPLTFQFRGDAVTRSLCEAKLTDIENEEVANNKHPYHYRMREPEASRS
jgi:hypothetical protein